MRTPLRPPRDPVEAAIVSCLDRLYGAALRLARNRADAEDLVQETVLRALTVGPRLDPGQNIPGYLFRTLGNLFINGWRHRNVGHRVVDDLGRIGLLDGTTYSSDSQKAWSDPHTAHRHAHLSRDLEAGLAAMPDRFRDVMILADLLDWTYAEIAAELKIPLGTVMSRLWRARRFLRARVEEARRADVAEDVVLPALSEARSRRG